MNRLLYNYIVTEVGNDSKLKLLRTRIVNGVLESFIQWHPTDLLFIMSPRVSYVTTFCCL